MYKLRAELRLHTADVRGIAASSEGLVATASRDKTVVIWQLQTQEPVHVLRGHTHFVNDLVFFDTNTLVTAAADNTLRVWDVTTGECQRVLTGHEAAVCAVAPLPDAQCVVSTSWDKTARVWHVQSGVCRRVLNAHSAAVWAACGLPDGRIVTVAADKDVRVWPLGLESSLKMPSSHTDVVRDVVPAPKGGFTTVANDSSLVTWNDAGQSFAVASRISDLHDGSYIYAVAAIDIATTQYMLVTGGEDNAVRLSSCDVTTGSPELSPSQTIMHPGTVWDVATAPGGDFATACSDGVARVFTKDPNAIADPDVQAAFEKAVSERQVSTKIIGGIDVSKLPTAEDGLTKPGVKDGENKIVRNSAGQAEVHMWSAAESRWTKVGEVVDGPSGAASGGEINGRSFDFVFEVELGEGGKKKKLGYNRGENSYLAAQRFIDDHELSQEFLDQIARFIEQQVPADALVPTGQTPSDPLTGGGRYVPGGAAAGGAGDGRSDPFTGGSSYKPSGMGAVGAARSAGAAAGQDATGGDPLTGASRYVPPMGGGPSAPTAQAGGGQLPPARKLIPYKDGMISYKTSDQLDKIQKLLSKKNTQLAQAGSQLALSIEEAQVFGGSLIPKLQQRGSGESTVLSDADCEIVEQLMLLEDCSVAVLDVARLVVGVPTGSAYLFGKKGGAILSDVLGRLQSEQVGRGVGIMACRFLCNMFSNRVSGSVARTRYVEVLSACGRGVAKHADRRVRETYASVLINVSVMLHEGKAAANERETVLRAGLDVVQAKESDEEVLYRVLVAIGTVMCDDVECAKRAVELGVAQAAADAAPMSPRLQQVALDIATIVAK